MSAYFVTLPSRMFLDRRLTLPQLRLLGIIASHMSADGGWSYFDQDSLAREYDEQRPPSQQAISKHVQKLLALGYIRVKPSYDNGKRAANGYTIVSDSMIDEPSGTPAELQAASRATHKANCICKDCHPELWEFPQVIGHVRRCICPACKAKRFKQTTVH